MTRHPLTETAAAEMYGTDEEGHTLYAWPNPERAWVVRAMGAAFDAGREHYTADDLRDTPAGQALIREGIAAARNLEWMQPRMTPGGRIYHPAIPGDEMRAVREDALAREAMQNMRESEQGRELMAEAWQEGAMAHAEATSRMTPETRRIINELMRAANPYQEGAA